MATVVLLSSGNINTVGAFSASDISNPPTASGAAWASVTSVTTTATQTITFASAHDSAGVLIPLSNNGGDTNDRSIKADLQQLIASVWTTIATATLTATQIVGVTNSSVRGVYLADFRFAAPVAVTTGAGIYRYQLTSVGGTTGTWGWNGPSTRGYIEYTSASASHVSGDHVWVGAGTLTINTSSTIGTLGIGTNAQVTISNGVTLTQNSPGLTVPMGNSRLRIGSSGSPATGVKWITASGVQPAFLWAGAGVNGFLSSPSKVSWKLYGAIPATQRAGLYATISPGATTFETSDDVSAWVSGWRFAFFGRGAKAAPEGTIYSVSGSPTYNAGTGRYTVTFTPALASQSVDVVANHQGLACLLDGYGITIESASTSGLINALAGGFTAMTLSGVAFVYTAQSQWTGGNVANPAYGYAADAGSTSMDSCAVFGAGMIPIEASPNGFWIRDCHLLGSASLSPFLLQTGEFGTVQGTQRLDIDGLWASNLFGGGLSKLTQTESTLNNVHLANGAGGSSIGAVVRSFTNFWGYGLSAGLQVNPVVSEHCSNIYIDNSAVALGNITNCVRMVTTNLVVGASNTADFLWTSNALTDLRISGVSRELVFSGTQSSIIDGSWIRASDYGATGDYKSWSKYGIFGCQSATKMTAQTTQSTAVNSADYRISSTTINGAKCRIAVGCRIGNAAYYAGTYTLPSVTVAHDGTTTVANAAASTAQQTLETLFTPASDGQEFTMTLAVKTDAGTPNGDVVWGDFALTVRKYASVFQDYDLLIQFTTADIYLAVAALASNPFIEETDSATVAAYTGISINYGTQTATISSSHTIRELYDFSQYSLTLDANMGEVEWLTTLDGSTFTVNAGWTVSVTGSLVEVDRILSGTVTVSSGGLFQDETGARWDVSGTTWYGKPVFRHVAAISGGAAIQSAVLAAFDASGNVRTTDASRVSGGLTTDASGDATGFYVYRIGATTYSLTEYVGAYGYDWLAVPVVANGTAIGASGSPESVRLVTDPEVTLSRVAALAITGVTVSHSAQEIDMGGNTLSDTSDYLKAKQASTDNIEIGVPGFVSYYVDGWYLDKADTVYTAKTGWEYRHNGDNGTFKGGILVLETPGTVTVDIDGSTVEYRATGTYDHRPTSVSGTITLINTSGGAVTAQFQPDTVVTNIGPDITVESSIVVPVTAPNLADGTRVQLYDVTNTSELDNSVVSGGTGYSFSYTYSASATLRLRAAYQSGLVACLPIQSTGIVSSGGVTFLDEQEADDIYTRIGIDGADMDSANGGPITADFANIQIDLNDPDDVFDSRHGISWWRYIIQTEDGIRTYNPFAITYNPDEYNILVDGPLQIENVSTDPLNITNGIWTRQDGNSLIAPTSHTIWWVPNDRVYSASAVLSTSLEGAETLGDQIKLIRAVVVGQTSGVSQTSTQEQFLSADGSKPRVTTTFDTNGNRTAVTVDAT